MPELCVECHENMTNGPNFICEECLERILSYQGSLPDPTEEELKDMAKEYGKDDEGNQ
jgi:hypothetical protein